MRTGFAEFTRWVGTLPANVASQAVCHLQRLLRSLVVAGLLLPACPLMALEGTTPLRGQVVDLATGKPIPARVYIQHEDGRWFFARSGSPRGSAVRYEKRSFANTNSVEMHVTLSAHPFVADLPPGRYTITVERGKEYRQLQQQVEVHDQPVNMTPKLERWINLAEQGWYSGDTHVHRTVEELPNVMLAEDLNVAFPLTYWVTKAFEPPARGDKNTEDKAGAELIKVDDTHVIYPRNTEYELFTVNGKRHTLGAVFLLNHRSVFDQGAPPVAPIAAQAHAEGALLDLDKHNWPWSMMLVPVMKVDLFELANNHVWRTVFGFSQWGPGAPAYMGLQYDGKHGSEEGWVLFGLQNYYALLNCGFRLRPTAGTASGVHPVPLGFGRVYVHLPDGFNYEAWLHGLNEGRSFVTTGPMLFIKVNGQPPGHVFKLAPPATHPFQLSGSVRSEGPLRKIEVIVNGRVAETLQPGNAKLHSGAHESHIDTIVRVNDSGWIAVRCFESRPDGRFRFAHSGPFHVERGGQPVRPRREEVEFLIHQVQAELRRNEEVLPEAALAEYRQALAIYQELAGHAR